MKSLVIFGLVSTFIVAWYVDKRDEQNRKWVERLAQYAAAERPHLDKLCASYFDWSRQMNDRVPGMERHCAAPTVTIEPR